MDEGQDQFHHVTHPHPLVAVEKKKTRDNDDNNDDVSCKICGERSSDELYGCDPCNFYLHQSCAKLQLPPTIQHFSHPCLLTLCLDERIFMCQICANFCDFYSYLCKPCAFTIEISCAMLPTVMESLGEQPFHHFTHGHPLMLREREHDDDILCFACRKHCSGQTYVCWSSKCKFFLHESCFNLPPSISHPLHPDHPLTVQLLHLGEPIGPHPRVCKVCYRVCYDFAYYCYHCKFYVHFECSVTISAIKFQGHHHNLIFVEYLDTCQTDANDDPFSLTDVLCSACGKSCKSSTAMFHCIQCDFHLHFNCGPLPCLIEHENHPCPLNLTFSPVMVDGGDKDRDWFICDVCEEDRDPRLPVYYCSNGCAYIVEIKCVISEVLLSLRGEKGNVDLMSAIFKHKTGKVIGKLMGEGVKLVWQGCKANSETKICKQKENCSSTMGEIIDALSKIEKREISTALNSTPTSDQDHDLWLTDEGALMYSDEDFRKLLALMDNYEYSKILPDLRRNKKKAVNVGNHLVISDLAPILEDLFAKYGDIFSESTLQSSGARTIFVHMLCETIRDMCTTRVADISQAELIRWWRRLKTLQNAGFKVEFVFNRLKRVVHAYYALEVERKANKDFEQIHKEIEEVSQDIDQLEAKLLAQKTKLVALKERCKRREFPERGSSSIVVKSFEEAKELRWMIVGEGLL